MGEATTDSPRRRGRPPASKSADTRQAILDGARALFGERGYGPVTNRELAATAGITTSALYHYVESKLDLYVAVHDDMQRRIYARFQHAEASESTFVGKLDAILEAAHELNKEDPSLARFVGVVRSDLRRHDDVAERLGRAAREREGFFVGIVDRGVETGEIQAEQRALVAEFIRLVLVGLTEGTSDSISQHRRAIDGIKAVVRGELITPIPS